MTATADVFGTTELLETILLSLDTQNCNGLRTLLLSQRVNQVFSATIAGSPRIQEALFFRGTTRVDSQTIESTPQPDVNPLIRGFRVLHRDHHDELEIRFYIRMLARYGLRLARHGILRAEQSSEGLASR
ncbi:hypothetical protein LTR10_007586 [Elasticomyces elasticus]|nr:hypothetical protein LTR10_007586 [Elasticomyces elasticus]KAK4970590.1 hypothetical protein LTR42_007565 [Elasticomyces elasticus]